MARRSQHNPLVRVGLALLISVLAGVLVAAVVAPVVGGVGLAVKSSADNFLALPAQLDTPTPSTRTTVLASDGSVLATFYSVNRIDAQLAQIPPTMRQAIVAIEDSRFYEHNGVDYKGTLRAAITNARSGGVSQGGSTLTQQYVKNALLDAATTKQEQKAAIEESADRKLREARYAIALEQKLPKDEILRRYLNIAYFGHGVYGIATAAQTFFNKPVEQLTLAESAELAGVVQNPNRYDVASTDPAVRADMKDRRDTVLGRMRDLGDITQAQMDATAALPLDQATVNKVGQDCGAPTVTAGFFCDYVRHELQDTPVGAALGKTAAERTRALFGGGLTIQTSLDPRIQAGAQAAVDQGVPPNDPSGVAAAQSIVEPGTGLIRAMAQDRPYGEDATKGQTQLNYGTGGQSGWQAGSTFKIFWLTAALEQGLPLSTSFNSPAAYVTKTPECRQSGGKYFTVHNAGDSEAGYFDMRSGTAQSVNTFYAQLSEKVGVTKPLQLAQQLGLKQIAPIKGVPAGTLPVSCTAYLGAADVSPLALAGAYATYAAHGKYCPVRAVIGILGPDGKPLPVPANACSQVIPSDVADTVTSVLQGVISGGTGTAAAIGRPAAGKTGTTDESHGALFAGYTPQLASVVWVGTVPNAKALQRIRINGRYYGEVFGGTIPAPIWASGMKVAMAAYPVQSFSSPTTLRTDGETTQAGTVPNVSGQSYSQAVTTLQAAGYTVSSGRTVTSKVRAGRVAYTSPKAGSSAAPGATIYVYRSSGPAPSAPPATPVVPPVQPVVPPPAPGAAAPTP